MPRVFLVSGFRAVAFRARFAAGIAKAPLTNKEERVFAGEIHASVRNQFLCVILLRKIAEVYKNLISNLYEKYETLF